MALLKLDAIVTKVYDLLRLDSRTSALDWFNGRRALLQMQKWPAGNVFLGGGTVRPFTIPGGKEAPVRVVAQIYYNSQEGAAEAEQLLRNGIDAVVEVLIDVARLAGSGGWDVGLSYAYPDSVSWRTIGAPEDSPALAIAEIVLEVHIIPTGS